MAPSISLPVGLANPTDGDLSSSWFPVEPPPRPPSSASSDSNGDDYEPPPVPERTPLAGTSFAHATDLVSFDGTSLLLVAVTPAFGHAPTPNIEVRR